MQVQPPVIPRHPWPVRLWHWTNAFMVTLSLATGLLIFNIHPRLYWGNDGHAGMPAILSLEVDGAHAQKPRFELHVGNHRWDVTRWMGVVDIEGDDQYVLVASYPTDFQFGGTRVWHFLSAWLLVATWILYALYLVLSGRLARFLWPNREDRSWRNVLHEMRQHALFQRATGEAANRYNVLQKISYLVVLLVLLPALTLSGLTMSNSVTAVFPDLFILFGGRQSARSVHFIVATLLLGFIVIHLIQVVAAGFLKSTRSMVTGR